MTRPSIARVPDVTEDGTPIEPGVNPAPQKFRIEIKQNGPYVVHGSPSLKQESITPDQSGISWTYRDGAKFDLADAVALCRCGQSANRPFCDGTHAKVGFDGTETASKDPLLDGAKLEAGPGLDMTDNPKFCTYARFCDAKGRVWNLIRETDDPEVRRVVKHETGHCPGGRLKAWDHATHAPYEPKFEASLGLIEDPARGISGGLWVRGGVRVRSADGAYYEIRNRVVLCRCGNSSNKPFCDGSHASSNWHDGLPQDSVGVSPEKSGT
jgi:CDGSH-type Zn-finger protein